MTDVSDEARCRRCCYPLRGLPDPVCPECGRSFDPADPKSFDVGQLGRASRYLLRPTGWGVVLLLVGAAVAVGFATRLPRGGWSLQSVDLLYYFPSRHGLRGRLLSSTDWAYVGALIVAALVGGWAAIRIVARAIVRRRRHRRPDPPPDAGRRAAVAMLASAFIGGGVVIGWPYRLARIWVRRLPAGLATPHSPLPKSPVPLPESMEVTVLRTGLISLPTPRERVGALKLLIEEHPAAAMPALLDAVGRESDPTVKSILLRMIGMYRRPETVDTIMAAWGDKSPAVRAAAADAIGFIHAPAFDVNRKLNPDPVFESDPELRLWHMLESRDAIPDRLFESAEPYGRRFLPTVAQSVADELRKMLEQRLIGGNTADERTAAARSLLRWQSGYRLRVAEWGVLIADADGQTTLAESLIEEIPPFVHRTGNPVREFADRVGQNMVVDKPVIHLTVDSVMAVDVQVLITDGRPWFAFPLPDDFTMAGGMVINGGWGDDSPPEDRVVRLAPFERPDLPVLENTWQNYPWIAPHHPEVGEVMVRQKADTPAAVRGVGVRWQSLIVSPHRLTWMVPPAVPADSKFAWWDRLRRVPSSWVSSRGEAERFLYYDGPTRLRAPVAATWSDGSLVFRSTVQGHRPNEADSQFPELSFKPLKTKGVRAGRPRIGLFIEVRSTAIGRMIELPDVLPATVVVGALPLAGEAVAAALHQIVVDAGLTDDEATGLVDCWRPQLFHTPGRRFVMLLTTAEYDALCPIRVDPPPTELARVGLVLTEFGTRV